ncbi:hypothetical protein [Streptosporangium roseum]|uniref:hypothetical protein n=1 Tax=Streptosporangium roseum TaxID=2001 RepID=UPI0012DBD54D|nr:hypothetical protein [Streptosporangium roseum]
MTMRVLLPVLAAGAAALPAGAAAALPARAEPPAAVKDLAIRSITLDPEAPVVGPSDTVRLVIEVVARGVSGPQGMTVQVEPGAPPESGTGPLPGAGAGVQTVSEPAQIPVPPALTYLTPAGPAGQAPAASGRAGRRHATGPAARAAGEWETWRFRPEKRLSRWYPAGRWTVAVTARGTDGGTVTEYAGFWLRREAKFSAVQAVRKATGVEIRGVLNRVDPQGYLDYAPFPGQTVEILHRTTEQEEWTETAEATTDLQGHFLQTVTGRRGGEWRARFAGTAHYALRHSRVHEASRR